MDVIETLADLFVLRAAPGPHPLRSREPQYFRGRDATDDFLCRREHEVREKMPS